ncbi:MAG: polysaccharide biosynthesis protein, partial [Tissierellia bacterium]|nr:polysaccharide biosynthesis protein [Tissierellia bacterium]
MFKIRNLILLILDIIFVNLSYILGLWLRFDGAIPEIYLKIYGKYALYITAIHIVVFYLCKLYRTMWRYASIGEFISVIGASFLANVLSAIFLMAIQSHLPRSIYAIALIFSSVLIVGTRFLSKASTQMIFHKGGHKNYKRILIIGGGEAGVMVAKELRKHPEIASVPVAFIDDDPE